MKSRFYPSNPSIHPSIHVYYVSIHPSPIHPSIHPCLLSMHHLSLLSIYVAICTINPSSINIPGSTIIYPSIISINPPTHHVSIHPSTHVYYPCIIYLYYLCICLSIYIIYQSLLSIHNNNQSTICQAI